MTEYLTEQEQIEQLKKWLRIYGLPALFGVVVGVVLFYGWNYYQGYRTRILTHASKVYDEMLTDRTQSNTEGAHTQAQKLFDHYAGTPYGEIAGLMLAREALNKKNYSEATKQLTWVIDNSHQAALRQIARLRLARLYIEDKQPENAINILKKSDDKGFDGLVNEVRGDAYLVMHHDSEAQSAYQLALQELPHSDEVRPLLEMKLDNIAIAG